MHRVHGRLQFLRCPFCHNAMLVLPEQRDCERLTDDEVFGFLQKARRGALELASPLRAASRCWMAGHARVFGRARRSWAVRYKLDTTGSNPELLSEIVKNKLVDRVAMDIKNAPEEYARTIGLESFDIAPVERSKEMLLSGDIGL